MNLLTIGERIINPRYIVAYDYDPASQAGLLTLAGAAAPIVIELTGVEAAALAAVLRRQAVDVIAAAALVRQAPPVAHTAAQRAAAR